MTVIDMQYMRYMNLLSRVSNVRTQRCFSYNNIIIFAVPKMMVQRAVGPAGRNVREIQNILGKKVKIVPAPNSVADVTMFIKSIVEPLDFKSIEVTDSEIVLNAGQMHKASLIGRNKRRLIELNQIVQDSFGKPLKIV